MKKEVFSAEAWERLRLPEKLDMLLPVTDSAAWMALASLVVLMASVAAWAIWGVMSTTVNGAGMILDAGGVTNVFHDSSGLVDSVRIVPGTRVRKGDIIATLSLPDLDNNIVSAQNSIQRSGSYQETLKNLTTYDSLARQKTIRGIITSSADGIVLDVHVNVGDFISAGATPICSIRRDYGREDLRAVLYVPAGEGKKVSPGMMVQLSPSEAEVENTGYLLGTVRSVSLYPVSSADIVQKIGNADLASALLGMLSGSGMEVRVELLKNDAAPSGYQWTSIMGEPPRISPGSYCLGTVIVERRSPLEKLLGKLGKWLRFY